MGVAKTYNVLGVFTVIIIANIHSQVFTIIHKKSSKNCTIFIRPKVITEKCLVNLHDNRFFYELILLVKQVWSCYH